MKLAVWALGSPGQVRMIGYHSFLVAYKYRRVSLSKALTPGRDTCVVELETHVTTASGHTL